MSDLLRRFGVMKEATVTHPNRWWITYRSAVATFTLRRMAGKCQNLWQGSLSAILITPWFLLPVLKPSHLANGPREQCGNDKKGLCFFKGLNSRRNVEIGLRIKIRLFEPYVRIAKLTCKSRHLLLDQSDHMEDSTLYSMRCILYMLKGCTAFERLGAKSELPARVIRSW
jgi:hypothetical protein